MGKDTSLPTGLSLVICDSTIEDSRSGKKSLIGVFNQITSTVFPVTHPQLSLYIALTDGRGTCNAEIKCKDATGGEPLLTIPMQFSFKNPNEVLEMTVDINNLMLEEPGHYFFSFECNHVPVIERRFIVKKR